MIVGYIALLARIIMLGLERIVLKFMNEYDSTAVASLFFLFAALFLTPVFFFVPVGVYSIFIPSLILLTLTSSLVYSFGFYAYVRAISVGDTSLVAPLYNSSLLWLLLMSFLFLDEDITLYSVSGGIIMFAGMMLLYPGSIKSKLNAIRESKSSMYMIAGSIFIAIGRTIDTYIIQTIDEKLYAFLSNLFIGLFLLLLVIYQSNTQQIRNILRDKRKIIVLSGALNGWSYLFLLIAISFLGVTIAEPTSLLSVFVTAYFAKRFLDEKVKERIPGMILMIIGAILLFIT